MGFTAPGRQRANVDQQYKSLFRNDVAVGSLEGLEVLLPERRVTFWPDRWTDRNSQTVTSSLVVHDVYGENAWCFGADI